MLLVCHKRAMELDSKVWVTTIKGAFRDVDDPETTYRELAALATANGTNDVSDAEVAAAMRAVALQNDA